MRVNGLFGWVEHNNTRSAVLLLSFVLLMQPLAAMALFIPVLYADPAHSPWYHWDAYAARYVPAVTLAAGALFAMQMWWHVKTVRKAVAFRFVDNADEPRLCALVEPLSIAAGIPTPYVGVIDNPALNAFACGITRKFSVVVFTRGIIDGLDDDELSCVIAHELMHIRNGDSRLIAAANVFLRNLALLDRFSGWKPRRYRQIAALLILPALFPVYLAAALLSQLCLRLGFASRLLISSAREFIADAEAVRLTQNPSALVSALQRIHGNSALPGLPLEQDAMMIDGIAQGRLATHPAFLDRIQAIVAITGQMALDARPRRDTRPGAVAHANLVMQSNPALERIAVTGAAPRTNALRAFRQAGNDRLILGLRWDLAFAMLATFLAAMTIHRGNIGGFAGQLRHVLNFSESDMALVRDKTRACQAANWKALLGQKVSPGACDNVIPAIAAHAKQFGINVTPDGRMLSDTAMAMLSPDELNTPSNMQGLPSGVFMTRGHSSAMPVNAAQPDGHPTDLLPSYPLPLHEAWQRLAQGSIAPYLRARQCGVLVHAHISAVAGNSVTWSITSETVAQIRFTAALSPDGPNATRVTLAVADFEKTVPMLDSRQPNAPAYPVAMRPALRPPLRASFAEVINALLQGSPIQPGPFLYPGLLQPGESDTANLCAAQRDALATGRHISIDDPPSWP